MMRGMRDRLSRRLDRWEGVGLFLAVVLLGVALVGALASALAALLYGVPS